MSYVCYGCDHRMRYYFRRHSTDDGPAHYCIKCEVLRFLKGIDPGNHEKGAISNGTYTMRNRGDEA